MSIVAVDSLQMVADSLRQIFVADSLRSVYVADSIRVADSTAVANRLAARDWIFGEGATLCEEGGRAVVGRVVDANVESLVSNPIYITIAALFALLYLIWLPHITRGGNIRWSYIRIHRRRNEEGNSREVVGRQRVGVVVATWSLGVTFVTLFVARAMAQYYAPEVDFVGTEWIVGGMLAVVAVVLYGWVVLKILAYLTLKGELIERVISLRQQNTFLGILFSSPLFIMSGLANYEQGMWIMQISVFLIVIYLLIFVRQSFLLFMRQNISILHWILYLCGVEILPISFLWAIAVRYILV